MLFKKSTRLLKEGLKKLDLFPTNQFIKFNKQSQYKTATGGLVSLGLIIIIVILFSSRAIQTFNRSIITSSVSSKIDTEPFPIKVVTSPRGGFMFALGIYGINLNDPLFTYFSISLFQSYYSPPLQIINSTEVPLVQCTAEHFAFNQDILQHYGRFNLSYSLCPPVGYQFNVGGKVSSQIFSQFTLSIQKCNNSIVSNCVEDAIIATILAGIGQFTFGVPIVNTIVNPNDKNYLLQFVEDRNYFTFNTAYGILAKAEIAEYSVETDMSIMPYTQTVTEYVNTIPTLFSSRGVPVSNNVYAQISFTKSSTNSSYTRSFSKLDDYFSYIGGLIGSALAFFFLLNSYSENSFYVDLASTILISQNPSFSFTNYNFFSYLGVMVKQAFDFIGVNIPWQNGAFFIRAIDEMKQQLDICLLIKKISFLEQAVSSILSEHQLDTLYLKDKRTLETIAKWREKHKIAQIVNINYRSQNSSEQRTNISLKNEELINQQSYQCHNQSYRQLLERMKFNIDKVVSQSQKKDIISQRIVKKLDSSTLQKIYKLQSTNRQQIELKETIEKEDSGSKAQRQSKNAVGNSFQPKSKKQTDEDLIIQIMDI